MSELSPAALAVMDAVVKVYPAFPDEVAAAAIKAVADQVVPEEAPEPTGMRPCGDTYSARWIKRNERMKMREQLLAIADELEVKYD